MPSAFAKATSLPLPLSLVVMWHSKTVGRFGHYRGAVRAVIIGVSLLALELPRLLHAQEPRQLAFAAELGL